MKKILTLVAAMMAVVMSARAEVEFAYEAGAELVSAYIWRGMYNGGLSLQPEGLVGFNALDEAIQFRAGVCASVGASDWGFRKGLAVNPFTGEDPNTRFMPEVDFIASLTAYGASVGFNEYYYCDDGSTHNSEIWFGYNFDHFFGQGAYINWYTVVAGADKLPETDLKKLAQGQLERQAFSTYIELGYDYTFENIGLTLGAQIGMSPWECPLYGNEKFAVVNLALKINKEWEFDALTLDLFATGSLNPDGLDKDNVFIKASGDDKLYAQKLNGSIGLGIWF